MNFKLQTISISKSLPGLFPRAPNFATEFEYFASLYMQGLARAGGGGGGGTPPKQILSRHLESHSANEASKVLKQGLFQNNPYCILLSGITRVQFPGGHYRGAPLFLGGGACQYMNMLYPAALNGDLFFQNSE